MQHNITSHHIRHNVKIRKCKEFANYYIAHHVYNFLPHFALSKKIHLLFFFSFKILNKDNYKILVLDRYVFYREPFTRLI